MRCPSTPTLALAVGALGSGAAQVAWNWPHGPVRIVAGLFATALVPLGVHLWARVPITGKWTRAIRAVVMTYICLAAAFVNLAHASMLLTGADNPAAENLWLALALITAIEAVMVMASLARRTPVVDAMQNAAKEFGLSVSTADAPTYVYRLMNAEGALLYVGITADITARLGRHRATKAWWPQVAELATEKYPNRAAALAVEQSAIANENPIHNKARGGLRDAVGGAPVGRVERTTMRIESAPAPAPTAPAAPDASTDEELARATDLVLAAREDGHRYGRGRLARDLGVTPDRARKLLEKIDAERPVHLVDAG